MGDQGDDAPSVPRTFTPLTREELTDAELLPRRFRFLEGEVRELIGVIRRQLIPRLEAQSEILLELRDDLRAERAARGALEERVVELQAELRTMGVR